MRNTNNENHEGFNYLKESVKEDTESLAHDTLSLCDDIINEFLDNSESEKDESYPSSTECLEWSQEETNTNKVVAKDMKRR